MHTYVHCGTVYNSKDLESTQMSIYYRLDRENVTHIHHGILCSHKKWVCVLCRDMDESRNHHSQQTDKRTENQTPYVFTHRRMLNENTWTQGGEDHTLGSVAGGQRRDTEGVGRSGRDKTGRNTRCGWCGRWRHQTTLPCMYLCNNLTWSAHVPQNLKYN